LGAQLLRAHLQVQALGSRLLVVVGAAAIHAAVAGAVHVIQVAVAVFSHAGLVAATAAVAGHDRRLCYGAAVAVRRVVGADGFLRILKNKEKNTM